MNGFSIEGSSGIDQDGSAGIDPVRVDFDALDAAAVGLLEPVVAADPGWLQRLQAALAGLADVALRFDAAPEFETLAELAVLLQARLSALADAQGLAIGQGAVDPAENPDENLRAIAGAWVADLIDLCAGRLDAGSVGALADGDADLARPLAALAATIAGLREVGPEERAAEPQSGVERRRATVARDELEVLADEAATVASEMADDGGDSLQVLCDGIERIGDAARLLGLDALASLLGTCAHALSQLQRNAAEQQTALDAVHPATTSALSELPAALERLFRSAGADRAALDLLTCGDWLGGLPDDCLAAVGHELDNLQLVGSRRVELPEPALGEPDLSLAIPAEADRSVVDSLLHELPALSAELSERIASLSSGDGEDVLVAQRLAHTLKGSANTVGVRGIAAITHRLEDLLQLVAAQPGPVPLELQRLLDDAGDCVAEMCEAVAGLGVAPAGATAVHARIVEWIGRLVDRTDEVAEPAEHGQNDFADRDEAGAAANGDEADTVRSGASGAAPGAETGIRVPASLFGRLLDLVDEAAILVAQAREQTLELERSRSTMRLGGDQLQDLAGELERLVDIRGLALSEQRSRQNFDSLELDEYNDLHTVSRRIAESGADGKLVEQQLGSNLSGLRDSLARLERLQAELRDCVLRTRMAPFESIAPRLHRTVRQAARMAGREVSLRIDGADTLVEAGMLSVLVDALAHLLRNAVDHGIEPPEKRRARGKPAAGSIRLEVRRAGAQMTVLCEDDGNGIDVQAVHGRAVALGLVDEGDRPDPATLHALVLRSGFSTRERASQLSGRGIGLDVVRQALEGLRGTIEIDSQPGRGTRIGLAVPLGLASLPVMLVRSATRALALSVRGIDRIVPAPHTQSAPLTQSASSTPSASPDSSAPADTAPPVLRSDGVDFPLLTIESLLGLPPDAFENDDSDDGEPVARSALLLHGADGSRTALVVPEPEAPRSVVVRSMPPYVPRVPGIDGVAVLGDGAVAPVLDLGALLVAHADGSLRARAAARPQRLAAGRGAPRCLVVDDSVSVRRTTEMFVRDLGFDVDGAADGLQALERLRRRVPDLLLVDMEMPRMNGAELVRALRADPRTSKVPVIMITSRYSERHKTLALDAGVNVFLTKPYTEDALASRIHACMEGNASIGLSGVSRMR